MFRTVKVGVIAATMTLGALTFTAGPAGAVDYANCTQLHHHFKYGVARSDRAARYQVRTGHYRPAVKPKIYRQNNESDADNDGTACEVSR